MANTTYDIGDKPVFTAKFYDTSDVLTDPSAVSFIWRVPAGTETTYVYGTASEVTKSATGIYVFAAPTITVQGRHVARAKGTSGLVAAGEYAVAVRPSLLTTP
jgi:hypothetical protein